MPAPSAARWAEIEPLLDQALDLAPDRRPALLAEKCSADPGRRAEVERLLRASEAADSLLGDSAAVYASPLAAKVVERRTVAPGDRLGAYLIERELGRGGTATVYLARDTRHDRLVALKVLRAELSASLGAERFAREIAIAAQLSHPHILPLHDSGSLDLAPDTRVLFYTMPYIEGRSLRERLRDEAQLPVDEVLRIARQVADALDHAHRHGVVHRDIKPENILLAGYQPRGGAAGREPSGRVEAVVADFGIARAVDIAGAERLTETGLALGTPDYMSPEQGAGSARLDARSDIYALGVVVYEMLAGQLPFTGPSPQAILARHAVDPVPSLRTVRPTVSPSLEQAVTRALAKVPADRFATAGAFADALAAPSSATPAQANAAPTVLVRPAPSAARRRWLVASAAGLAIAGAGLAGALARKPVALDPTLVLVAPFQNRSGDSTLDPLGEIAADYIARGLAETRLVQVVDARSEAAAQGRRLDPADARALARSAGAGNVVWGSYDRTPGDSLEVQAEVLDTRTGRVARLVEPASAPTSARVTAVEAVRQRVMGALATVLDPRFADWQEASQPPTYEAYQQYLAGENAGGDNCLYDAGCTERRIAHYRRAAAIDSSFTLPVTSAAFAYWFQGDCPRVDSIAGVLQPRLERLPAMERVQIEWATNVCHGNRLVALSAANEALREFPKSERISEMVAELSLSVNRPGATAEILERFDPATSRMGKEPDYWITLLAAYHRLGKYDRALELIARGRRLKRQEESEGVRRIFLQEEVSSYAALGRLADARRAMDEMVRQYAAVKVEGVRLMGLLEGMGQELAVHGHGAAAQDAYARAIAWAKARPAEQQTRDDRRELAGVLNSAGHWDEALALYRSLAAQDSSDEEVHAALGDLAARRGDRREAGRVDRWLAARGGRYAGRPYFRARIAGLLGEPETAMGLLRLATEGGFPRWRDAHTDPDLAPLRSDPAFQQWIRPQD